MDILHVPLYITTNKPNLIWVCKLKKVGCDKNKNIKDLNALTIGLSWQDLNTFQWDIGFGFQNFEGYIYTHKSPNYENFIRIYKKY